jgi:CubicO group peptidase (beta-lactamase class C family)
MERVTEDDTHPLPPGDAVGYTRQGLGPNLGRAPKEGAGWLFGAAELAMSPSDLARWDISLIDRSLLKPASYEAELEPTTLRNGTTKAYGLGLDIERVQGRMRIGHSGSGSGFLSANRIWPQQKTAIIAFTNNDWADPDDLVDRISFLVLSPDPVEARARAVFSQYQQGTLDRTLFTDNGNSLLTSEALADLKGSLGPLGPPLLMVLEREGRRGGMFTRVWKILCGAKRLRAVERGYPDGKLEQFLVTQLND